MGEDSACILVIFFMPFPATKNNDPQLVCDKLTSMSTADNNPDAARHTFQTPEETRAASGNANNPVRDIAEVAAVEVITTKRTRTSTRPAS